MSERTNISETAFDGAAVWGTLPADVQARIGAAALELGVAMGLMDHAGGPAHRAGEKAFDVAADILRSAVLADGVPEPAW